MPRLFRFRGSHSYLAPPGDWRVIQENPLVDKPHLHAASMISVREGGVGRRPDSGNRDLVEKGRPGGKLQLYPAGSLNTNLLLKKTVSHRQRYKECFQVPYIRIWPASRVQWNLDLTL